MGIVRKIFRKVKKLNKKQETKKEYSSYDDALKDCPTQKVYENTELCCVIGDKTKNFIKYSENKPYAVKASNVFLVNIIQTYFFENSIKSITILDFGGACGIHYFETRKFLGSNYSIRWFVVETPEMVRSALEHGLENDELHFIDNIEKINSTIDIVHSSSTLQYVSSWNEYLNQLIRKEAKYMLFNRMMFNENDRTFITIQKSKLTANGPGVIPEKYEDKDIFYPHTTISYNEFNKTIIQKGYDMEWSFEEYSGSYRINNEKIIGRGLLYKKHSN